MTKEFFVTTLERRIARTFPNNNIEVVIHWLGEEANGDTYLENFIKQTNEKYFHTTDTCLLGDFVELRIDNTAEDREGYIRLELKSLIDTYEEEGKDWNKIMEQIKDTVDYVESIKPKANSILDMIGKYNEVRDKLIIRPLNYEYNKASLEDYVYKKIGDIALVLYAIVNDDEENHCLSTVKIPNTVYKDWNIDIETVMREAMIQTRLNAPARIYKNVLGMNETPDRESDLMSTEFELELNKDTVPLVTTAKKTNGAIALFYPGVKEKIAELFGSSFYVAFTSIHEAVIHAEDTIEPVSIRYHVRETNRIFGKEETLSGEVYFYNKNDKTFRMAN